MTLGACRSPRASRCEPYPGGRRSTRSRRRGGGGQADRADEQVHHVALPVRDVAGHGRGDGVARHLLGRDGLPYGRARGCCIRASRTRSAQRRKWQERPSRQPGNPTVCVLEWPNARDRASSRRPILRDRLTGHQRGRRERSVVDYQPNTGKKNLESRVEATQLFLVFSHFSLPIPGRDTHCPLFSSKVRMDA